MKKNIAIIILVILLLSFFVYSFFQYTRAERESMIAIESTVMLKSCEQETSRLNEELRSAQHKINDLQLRLDECGK